MPEQKPKPKTKICVIGLKNNQCHRVEAECGEIADLRFFDQRRNTGDIPDCDHVVLMPKFLKKRWTRGAYDAMDRDRVHLNWGGVSSLIITINDLSA